MSSSIDKLMQLAPQSPRVLVVDDDPELTEVLRALLEDVACHVDVLADGLTALDRVYAEPYDAIVLDVRLPGLDGITLCQRIRQRKIFTPILILTARTDEADRVLGIEVGADDYVTKPFSERELQARVKALLRRATAYAGDRPEISEVACGDLRILIDRREVMRRGVPIELTAKEFDLLLYLASHPGRVYTRDQLLDAVWAYSHAGYGHTVDSHINRLRTKIENDARNPEFVLTVRSVGYKFRETSTTL